MLNDAQYDQVLAIVKKWRDLSEPSYDLHSRNCVFFVGDVARALGMKVDDDQAKSMSRPRSYIIHLIQLNPGVSAVTPGSRAAHALRAPD